MCVISIKFIIIINVIKIMIFFSCFSFCFFFVQVEEIVALLNAVFKRQKRTFQKDEKVIAYPAEYFKKLFSLYRNVVKS